MLDANHPLLYLASLIDWARCEKAFAPPTAARKDAPPSRYAECWGSWILRSHSFPFCLLLSTMALAASMLAGCGGASTDSAVQADSIVSDTVSTMADDSVHSVQASYVYRDTIVGRFVKGVTDTLVIESGEMEGNPWEALEWTEHKLYSLGGSIDTLGLGTQFTVQIANVGDLDGNGSDELFLGFGAVSGSSYEYRILTYRRGAWGSVTLSVSEVCDFKVRMQS